MPIRHFVALTVFAALPSEFVAQTSPASAPTAVAPLHQLIDRSRLRTGVDSFAIFVQGTERGWQRLTRDADGAGWRLSDAIAIASMVQQESVIRIAKDLREVALRQEGTMRGKPMRISLDFSTSPPGTRVSGSADTPSNPAGVLPIDTVATDGVVDDNSVTPLVVALPWKDGAAFSFPVIASGKGTTSVWSARALGADSVTVPAGHFDTWRVEVKSEAGAIVIHITRAAPFRIVRMQPVGTPFDIQLVR